MDPDSNIARQRAGGDNGGGRRLQVSVTDGRGRPIRDGGLSRWLASTAPLAARGSVAIALVTDAHSRKLNSQYRRSPRPTDVLSFPGSQFTDPGQRTPNRFLGDIVIATGTARRQAREVGHSYQAELRVLALHGLLHLLGYDHEQPDDAGRMRRIEARLRRRGGLRAGLIERS
ncbi:MAG: rRNA maturation RNase YbeY [Vicinamibacterales bacterium]